MRFPFPPHEPAEPVAATPVAEVQPPEHAPEAEATVSAPVMAIMATAKIEVSPPANDDVVPQAALQPVVEINAPDPISSPAMMEAEPISPAMSATLAPVAAEPEPEPALRPRPRARRKIIAFPAPLAGADVMNRLADPVLPEQPRILDVPVELEAYPATPFLDGLQFGPDPQQQAATHTHSDHIELPFQPATLPRRACAALIDCALVAAGTVLFAAAGYKLLPRLVITKPLLLTAALVPVLLWAIYQYLLTAYAGTTAGMLAAKIRLRTFKGAAPKLRHRRRRVMALYFSTASLMMGLLWALVDVDALCWHDRISRTYLASRE